MDSTQEKIVREIRMRNTYEAELKSLLLKQCENDVLTEHMKTLQARIEAVDIWLSFIPAAQAYVIKKHLVDGLDWTQVTQEYNAKWGGDCTRHERTLERYQQRGLRTIQAFVELHYSSYAYMLNTKKK